VEAERFLVLVGRNIRHARHLAGRTQEQVEGVTLRYYAEIERGVRNPTLEVLLLLAEQFGCTVADFVDVPGGRVSDPRLEKRKPADPPRPGRKPKSHSRSR
jgi:transcriptional regulator with XRE-family HTH domain